MCRAVGGCDADPAGNAERAIRRHAGVRDASQSQQAGGERGQKRQRWAGRRVAFGGRLGEAVVLESDAVGHIVGWWAVASSDFEGLAGPSEREGALASPSMAKFYQVAAHPEAEAPILGHQMENEWRLVPDVPHGRPELDRRSTDLARHARHDPIQLQHSVPR